MNDNQNLICPLALVGWYSYQGRDDLQTGQDVLCLQGQCAWYDCENRCCALMTLTRAIDKSNSN